MESAVKSGFLNYLFTFLRIAIGWHFLYEGVTKFMDPTWSASGYLSNATGPFAEFFQSLTETYWLLSIIDILNIAGLILIGFGLFLGFKTRLCAALGAVLVAFYYLAMPPLQATPIGYGIEGHYLVVNKNFLEVVMLVILAVLPSSWMYGLDNLGSSLWKVAKKTAVEVPDEVNHNLDVKSTARRNILKNLISLPFLGGFVFAYAKNHGWQSYEEGHLSGAVDASTGASVKLSARLDIDQLHKEVPKGKIGDVELSRLICGGNLISGYAHSRDLIYVSTFLKTYFTDKKVFETFQLCEQCGINTTALRVSGEEIRLLNAYWKAGGKIQWLAPAYPDPDNYRENIDLALDNGAIGVQIMGNIGDEWVRDGRVELIGEVIEYIKSKGVIAGLTGHELATFEAAEAAGVQADFYQKTMHPTNYWSYRPEEPKEKMIIENYAVDNYWDRTPEATVEFMEKLGKPWIAFKVLAAGAIKPRDGLRYAFEKGADFACLGMFDFQVVEDANALTEVLEDRSFNRTRAWMA